MVRFVRRFLRRRRPLQLSVRRRSQRFTRRLGVSRRARNGWFRPVRLRRFVPFRVSPEIKRRVINTNVARPGYGGVLADTVYVNLTEIAQGTGLSNRVGRKINIVSVNFQVFSAMDASGNASGYVYLALVRSNIPGTMPPNTTDGVRSVYTSDQSPTGGPGRTFRRNASQYTNWKVLKLMKWRHENSTKMTHTFRTSWKGRDTIRYDTGNTDGTEVSWGNLFFLMWSTFDHAGGVAPFGLPSVDIVSSVYFTDA